MAPTIHCVRHAQGFHNLGNYELPDPKLTPLGEDQCAALQKISFFDQSKISLVVASPLRRTIHTASLVFKPALRNGKCQDRIVALPDAQETSDDACDIGSDLDLLKGLCIEEDWPVNLSMVKPDWNVKTYGTRYSPSARAIRLRTRDARKQIRQMARELIATGDPDPQIVLVTHGGYLHYFTDDWEDAGKLPGTGWENTETRAYTFRAGVEDDSDEEAFIEETSESMRRRGKERLLFTREQQESLFAKSMQDWEDQGLQNPSKIDQIEVAAYITTPIVCPLEHRC